MKQKIGDKESQRRALRERNLGRPHLSTAESRTAAKAAISKSTEPQRIQAVDGEQTPGAGKEQKEKSRQRAPMSLVDVYSEMGRKGGKARAKKLTKAQRSQIALKAAETRWSKERTKRA